MTEGDNGNLPDRIRPQRMTGETPDEEIISAEIESLLQQTDSRMNEMIQEIREAIPTMSADHLTARLTVIDGMLAAMENSATQRRALVLMNANPGPRYADELKEALATLILTFSALGIYVTDSSMSGRVMSIVAGLYALRMYGRNVMRILQPLETRLRIRTKQMNELKKELEAALRAQGRSNSPDLATRN